MLGGAARRLGQVAVKEGADLLSDISKSFVRFASKKQGGSTANGRDSNPKYLGLKVGNGQYIYPGNIIVRQRGTKFHPAEGVGMGKDHTIFATTEGNVHIRTDKHADRKYIYIAQAVATA